MVLILILRLLHVVGGVFWVGGATVLAWFLLPAAAAGGADGGRFVRQVMITRRMAVFMGGSMGVTLLSGFWLYGRNIAAGGEWMATRAGMGFSAGAAAAVLATLIGMGFGATAGRRMGALGAALALPGARPDPAQIAEMEKLQRRMGSTAKVVSVLLVVATAAMGTARYW